LIKENSEILGLLTKRQNSLQDTDLPHGPTESSKSKPQVMQRSPANKPITFNPFPNRQPKKPKEVGLKLGLYPPKK